MTHSKDLLCQDCWLDLNSSTYPPEAEPEDGECSTCGVIGLLYDPEQDAFGSLVDDGIDFDLDDLYDDIDDVLAFEDDLYEDFLP